MSFPKNIDAVDLLYAVDSLCGRRPLRTMGLNRVGYRRAKQAQNWFFDQMVKALNVRRARSLKEKK